MSTIQALVFSRITEKVVNKGMINTFYYFLVYLLFSTPCFASIDLAAGIGGVEQGDKNQRIACGLSRIGHLWHGKKAHDDVG